MQGCAELGEVHQFGVKDIGFSREEAREMLAGEPGRCSPGDRRRIDLLSALMSDGAVKDDKVRATPYCAMFGSGHQHFLERLGNVPLGIPPRELVGEVTAEDLNSPETLGRALFESCDRRDRTQSFRWDPVEDRRYALRFKEPSSDKGMTVHGANRLASVGLPLLTAIPRKERGEVRLLAIAASSGERGRIQISWPIWSRPTTLRAVVAMLACGGTREDLPGLGILATYRSDRISVEKFFNFARGRMVLDAEQGVRKRG